MFSSVFTTAFIILFDQVRAIHKELFTTNAVCSANYCINPIFPGLEDLYVLNKEEFACSSLTDVSDSLVFCADVVNYNPSLKKAETNETVSDLVRAAESKAMNTYC